MPAGSLDSNGNTSQLWKPGCFSFFSFPLLHPLERKDSKQYLQFILREVPFSLPNVFLMQVSHWIVQKIVYGWNSEMEFLKQRGLPKRQEGWSCG